MPDIEKEIDYGFCFLVIKGFEWKFYDKKGGDLLQTPARTDHTLTACEKLQAIKKAGFEVDSELLIRLSYAIRERRNRGVMGWSANVRCKNTLNAVESFIKKSYPKFY